MVLLFFFSSNSLADRCTSVQGLWCCNVAEASIIPKGGKGNQKEEKVRAARRLSFQSGVSDPNRPEVHPHRLELFPRGQSSTTRIVRHTASNGLVSLFLSTICLADDEAIPCHTPMTLPTSAHPRRSPTSSVMAPRRKASTSARTASSSSPTW